MATATKEYSVEEKLVSLIKLQKVDSKLDEFGILKGELPMEVSDLEDEIAGLQSRLTRIEEKITVLTNLLKAKNRQLKKAKR